MTAPGIKAWSIFGDIQIPGMPAALAQMRGFDLAGRKAGVSLLGLKGGALAFAGAAAGAGIGIAQLGRSAVRSFAEFDDKMTKSLAIMGDISDIMRGEMSEAAKLVGRTTEFSANQAAESYFFLASAGLSAEQSLGAMPTVARFAQAGMFDLARATDLLTDAQSALGLTVRDNTVVNMQNMIRVSDVLVKANTLANATVEQFSEALTNRAGAALRLVNKEIEEGVAVLAAMADQGVKGAEAGTRLDIVMRDLQTKAMTNRDAFEEYGITVFDASGKMRSMVDIIRDLERATESMSDAQKRSMFGREGLGFADRSVAATLSLLGFSDAIDYYEQKLYQAGGTTQDVADRQLTSLNAKIEMLKGSINSLAITIGADLAPGVQSVVEHTTDWVNKVEELYGAYKRTLGIAKDLTMAATMPTTIPRILARRGRQMFGPGEELFTTGLPERAPGVSFDTMMRVLKEQGEAHTEELKRIALEDLRVLVEIGERHKVELLGRLKEELEAHEDNAEVRRELLLEIYRVEQDIFKEQARSRNELVRTMRDMGREWERGFRGYVKPLEMKDLGAESLKDDGFNWGEEVGESLIDGMIAGIQGESSRLERVIKGLAEMVVVAGLKSLLGIGSPSRVSMTIGQQFVQGLVLGMESQQSALAMQVASLRKTMTMGALTTGSLSTAMRPTFDFSRMPAARDPRQAARDADWMEFFSESVRAGRERGVRY